MARRVAQAAVRRVALQTEILVVEAVALLVAMALVLRMVAAVVVATLALAGQLFMAAAGGGQQLPPQFTQEGQALFPARGGRVERLPLQHLVQLHLVAGVAVLGLILERAVTVKSF